MKDYGLDIVIDFDDINISYEHDTVGPEVEIRSLDAIRASLQDPNCKGPEKVYAIAMDVCKEKDLSELKKRDLLFGVVTYSKGKLGEEPIRSQGHIHAISQSCQMSTPELYEIWTGKAIIYMQEFGEDDPGKCYAVVAEPGDKVLVPPNWVHATISADATQQLTFGAWCVRDYGFEYEAVKKHGGIAHFPKFEGNDIIWEANDSYDYSELIVKKPREYSEFNISDEAIYRQFEKDKDKFMFISKPQGFNWDAFIP